jgi:hypothetical protein
MKNFKEYLEEGKSEAVRTTGVMSDKDILKYISFAKLKAIAIHPWFREYFGSAHSLGIPVGFRYTRDEWGFERIDVVHGPMSDTKPLRRLVTFSMQKSGRKITQAELFQNWDNQRDSHGLVWKHVKSLYKEEE